MLVDWLIAVEVMELPEFRDCTKAYRNWFHEILNSMDVPWSNGFIEGCNKKTKVLTDCQKTIVLSLQDPAGVAAISQNNFASCMFSGEYEIFLIRLHPQGVCRIRNARSSRTAAQPRRCAPRNDTSGTFSTR